MMVLMSVVFRVLLMVFMMMLYGMLERSRYTYKRFRTLTSWLSNSY